MVLRITHRQTKLKETNAELVYLNLRIMVNKYAIAIAKSSDNWFTSSLIVVGPIKQVGIKCIVSSLFVLY